MSWTGDTCFRNLIRFTAAFADLSDDHQDSTCELQQARYCCWVGVVQEWPCSCWVSREKLQCFFSCSGFPSGRAKRDSTVIEFETFLPKVWTSRALVSLVLCPSWMGFFVFWSNLYYLWLGGSFFPCFRGFFSFWTTVQYNFCVLTILALSLMNGTDKFTLEEDSGFEFQRQLFDQSIYMTSTSIAKNYSLV